DLLDKARKGGNGSGERFAALYDRGDINGYKSHSEADFALCRMLCFWCDNDRLRVEDLFNRSALVSEKWTGRSDYRERTIKAAMRKTTRTYADYRARAQFLNQRKKEKKTNPDDNQPRIKHYFKQSTCPHKRYPYFMGKFVHVNYKDPLM